MYTKLSDENLIKKIASCDELAFKEVYKRYNKAIFNYLNRLVFDKTALEDLFQNTFLKVYSKANKFNSKYKFKSWIYKIATNEYLDYYKKLKREKSKILLNNNIQYDKVNNFDIEQVIYDEQKLSCFHDALKEISSPFKEAFIMRRMQGLSLIETSEALNVSDRTVKNYCDKAENFIKAFLQEKSFN